MKNLRKEKGSISVLVLITILFFITILSATFIISSVQRRSQLKSTIELKETYEQDINNIEDVRAEVIQNVEITSLQGAKSEIMLLRKENTKIKVGNEYVWIPAGYKVADDSADTVEYGIVITDAATNGNEWVWVPVDSSTLSKMYEENASGISLSGSTGVKTTKYSSSEIINGITRGLPNSTSYREPDVVVGSGGTSYDAVESNRKTAGFVKEDGSTMTLAEMAQTMVDEYSDMLDSIKTYGGFYIGRYELSEAGVKENQPVLAYSTWYELYAKCKTLAKEGSNVQTRMIWGCQWDVACNWIANNGDCKDIEDSSTWGNYKATDVYSSDGKTIIKASGTSTKLNTGVTTFTRANNIYDLAGNCYEFTQEAYNTYNRAYRGGYYNYSGSSYPASFRFYRYPDSSSARFIRLSSHTLFVALSPDCENVDIKTITFINKKL